MAQTMAARREFRVFNTTKLRQVLTSQSTDKSVSIDPGLNYVEEHFIQALPPGVKLLPGSRLVNPDLDDVELAGPSGVATGSPFNHIKNFQNPHKTTARQVGAYSRRETDTLLETLVSRMPETGVLRLKAVGASLNNGVLTIDVAAGNVARIVLNQNVSDVVFINLPGPHISIPLRLYVQQNEVGNYGIDRWPESTVWPGGNNAPVLSPMPLAIDMLAFDIIDSGNLIFSTLVARNYLRGV